LETHYEIYLNYYKNKGQIDEIVMLASLNNKQELKVHGHKNFKNNYPRTLAFIRTREGILAQTDANKRKIGGQFLFYIR